MNPERSDAEDRLLGDAFTNESEQAHTRHVAMKVFRRAVLRRRVGRIAGLATLIAIAAMPLFRRSQPHVSEIPSPVTPSVAAVAPALPPAPVVTDQELIAAFPTNSCFLAEVNGRQILVFNDSAMRDKFLHGAH